MKKAKKLRNRVVALGLCFTMGLSTIASATTLEEIQNQKDQAQDSVNELQQVHSDTVQKIQDKNENVKALEEQKAQELKALEALDQEILGSRAKLQELNKQVAGLEEDIKNTQKDIEVLKAETAKTQKLFEERLGIMYKKGEFATIEVLLSADGINDFLSRNTLMKNVAQYDRDLIRTLKENTEKLRAKELELQGHKASLEIAVENQQNELKKLETAQNEKKKLIESLATLVLATQEEITRLEQNSQEYEGQIAQKLAEIAELQKKYDQKEEQIKREEEARKERERLERERLERQKNQNKPAKHVDYTADANDDGSGYNSSYYRASGFCWPAKTYRITSTYGYRPNPFTGKPGNFHTGVDLAAPEGTHIMAALSGRVTLARYNGGYGNCIKIDHGNGTKTLYGHLVGYNVSVGDWVEKGQVIGYMGTTGWSTGPHLHFELFLNNVRVDPLLYL